MTDYDLLCRQLTALTEGVEEPVSNLANAASLLYHTLPEINWAGVYLLRGGTLRLGPFMGQPACVEIPIGKGVCGSACAEDRTFLVPDVHSFPGHIACDAASNSEIVIPLHVGGALYGVLDIDSPVTGRFSETDREGLERFALALEQALSQRTDDFAAGRIARAEDYAKTLFRENAGGHDVAHTMRVYRCAMRLAAEEGNCDKELVALAALLHDADDDKLFATKDNANARAFLEREGIARERIERICAAINGVSFRKNRGKRPETVEGQIVQDADRLDAIGAVGVARCFAFGGEHGRSMEDSIRHFHEKLLLLRDTLNTESARRLAQPRHAFLEEFLREYETETR